MGQSSSKGANTLPPPEIACPSPPPPPETPPVSSWAGITALEGSELQSLASEIDRANKKEARIINFTGAHAKVTTIYSVNEPEPLAWSMWSPYRLYLAVDREEAHAVLTDGFRTALQARANTPNPWGGAGVVFHQVPLDAVDRPTGACVPVVSKYEKDGILLVCDVQPGQAQSLHWEKSEGPLTALTEAGIDGVATWLYEYHDDEAKQRGTSFGASFSTSIMGDGFLSGRPKALFMPGADSCVSVRYLCEYTYSDIFIAGQNFLAGLLSSPIESDGPEST